MKKSPTYYLVFAIFWTAVAIAALVLMFTLNANSVTKFFGLVLIVMCVAGQWLRYRKMK